MPKKPCLHGGGGCPGLAQEGTGGLCEAHAAKRAIVDAENQKYYGWAHKQRRVEAFERDEWTCQRCGWVPGLVKTYREFASMLPELSTKRILAWMTIEYKAGRRHLTAHHIQPVEIHPELADDIDNYSTVCDVCHAKETPGGPRYH